MKANKLIPTFLLMFHVVICCYGQIPLTKEEIYNYYNSPREKYRKANEVVKIDSSLNRRLLQQIDSLQKKGIDSFIVYSTAFVGYASASNCDTGLFPIETYLIWCKNDVSHAVHIAGRCQSSSVILTAKRLFEFHLQYKERLRSEIFTPVITSGMTLGDSLFKFTMKTVSHEPCYSFYYRIGGESRSFYFTKSDIEDTSNIFHKDNLQLVAYSWWKAVKEELDKTSF